jgi:hypothetical protein
VSYVFTPNDTLESVQLARRDVLVGAPESGTGGVVLVYRVVGQSTTR